MAIDKTRNTLITQALRMIGALAEGEDASASQIQDGAIRLDWLVKRWQATGVHLWTTEQATLFLVKGQQSYTLGGTNTDNATISFTETTLSADEASGQTTLSVTSSTGAAASDFVGITLDDNTIQWTTLTTVSPFLIADALTSKASSGNAVVFYTTKVGKVLRIPDARRVESSIETDMMNLGRKTYLDLPAKDTEGSPVQYYYQPRIDDGTLFIWNTASNAATQRITFSFYQPIDVFSTSASAADFPNEWLTAIVYNLAVDLAPDYGQPLPAVIVAKADQFFKDALEWDDEEADLYFTYAEGPGRG